MHKLFFAGGSFTYPDLIRFHPAVTANYTKPSHQRRGHIQLHNRAGTPAQHRQFRLACHQHDLGAIVDRGDFAEISGFHDRSWSAGACGAFNRAGQGWDLVELSIARLIRCALHIVT